MEYNEVRCPHCKKAMRFDATICPHCRTEATESELATRKQDHKNNFIGCGVLAVLACLALAYCSGKDEQEKSKTETAEERSDRVRANCLSGWDGSVRSMTSILEDQVSNDPNSYEHIETRTTPPDEKGYRQGVTEFRAKNGFGGIVRSSVTFTFDDKSCAVIKWKINE